MRMPNFEKFSLWKKGTYVIQRSAFVGVVDKKLGKVCGWFVGPYSLPGSSTLRRFPTGSTSSNFSSFQSSYPFDS